MVLSSTYPANAAQLTAINTPTPIATTTLGNVGLSPATQYLAVATQALPQLTADLVVTQLNPELTDDFAIWNGSGTVTVSAITTFTRLLCLVSHVDANWSYSSHRATKVF